MENGITLSAPGDPSRPIKVVQVILRRLLRVCPECRSAYHSECWQINHGCAVFGCPGGMGSSDNLKLTRVYSSPLLPTAQHVMNFLELNGITCSITNQYPGSSATEAGTQSWPELWVSENDLTKAAQLINTLLTGDGLFGSRWLCPNCGEKLEGQFTQCWKYGTSRP